MEGQMCFRFHMLVEHCLKKSHLLPIVEDQPLGWFSFRIEIEEATKFFAI